MSNYPHVARCPACADYLDEAPTGLSATVLVNAVLAYHDTCHQLDTLWSGHHQFSWI